MHELGITRGIVDIVEKSAREQGAERVLSVTVVIGELSGVVAEAVEFCFEACTRGTPLEAARLIVERVPGRGRCPTCGAEPSLDPQTFACPECGGFGLEILQGNELSVTEMEIE